MSTQLQLRGANCPACFDTVRSMLSEDPGIVGVEASFSAQCMSVELGTMSVDELMGLLHRNLHGIEVAENGEQVMVDIAPAVGGRHFCGATPSEEPAGPTT